MIITERYRGMKGLESDNRTVDNEDDTSVT